MASSTSGTKSGQSSLAPIPCEDAQDAVDSGDHAVDTLDLAGCVVVVFRCLCRRRSAIGARSLAGAVGLQTQTLPGHVTHIYFLSLRLSRDALHRIAVATAVPCSLRTVTEGRQNILRDDDFHSGLPGALVPGQGRRRNLRSRYGSLATAATGPEVPRTRQPRPVLVSAPLAVTDSWQRLRTQVRSTSW